MVPVLSVQMTLTALRVATAKSRRTRALRRTMGGFGQLVGAKAIKATLGFEIG